MERAYILSPGTLNLPVILRTPDTGAPERVVLGVHGLGGSGEDEIQTNMAEEMALFGSATIRFDFPGHGRNPSDDLNLADCQKSLLAAAKEARRLWPEVETLCVFASGFGAFVTLSVLDGLLELGARVKMVIQTPALVMHETILAMGGISRETLWAMDRITIPAPRPITLTYAFYEQLRECMVMNACPIPVLILQGQEDAYVRMEDIHAFKRINDGAKLVIIPGASHRFLEDGAWDMVLDLVRDWFLYEDVLLCDWE